MPAQCALMKNHETNERTNRPNKMDLCFGRGTYERMKDFNSDSPSIKFVRCDRELNLLSTWKNLWSTSLGTCYYSQLSREKSTASFIDCEILTLFFDTNNQDKIVSSLPSYFSTWPFTTLSRNYFSSHGKMHRISPVNGTHSRFSQRTRWEIQIFGAITWVCACVWLEQIKVKIFWKVSPSANQYMYRITTATIFTFIFFL